MEIRRQSWIFRVAYMGTPGYLEPDKVDRCTIIWRFIPRVVAWPFLSFGLWLVFGLLSLIGHFFYWPISFFFMGQYPVYEDDRFSMEWDWLPKRDAFFKLNIFKYGLEDIAWLSWLSDGKQRWSPALALWVLVCAIVIAIVVFYFIPFHFIPWLWPRTGSVAIHYAADTFGLWIWPILLGLLYLAIRIGWKKFAATDSGKVIVSHFKEWKADHCPIYKVV